MDIQTILGWLQATSLATSVRESSFWFPSVEALHVLAVAFVAGSVAVVDLRLLGVAVFSRSIRQLMHDVLPFTWSAFGFAVLTGGILLSSAAVSYSHNLPLRLKMTLLALAAANMLIFHTTTCRDISRWDEAVRTPIPARLAGAASLLLWILIIACGRWIGFANSV